MLIVKEQEKGPILVSQLNESNDFNVGDSGE
jgi:hypothetical protein